MATVRRRKRKAKLTWQGKLVVGFSVFLIVLSVLTVIVILALNSKILQDGNGIGNQYATPSNIKDKVTTFLIVGIADDENERESTRLTDTIMLATIDFPNKRASVLQIPRDTYVGDTTPTGKINAIYNRTEKWEYHGLDGLTRMIHEMFQINIDHYVTLKMDGFENIIDSIGGVPMNVPVDMELNGTMVRAGQQTLNGEQAIAVVRTRNVYQNGDLGRIETQRAFLSAFASKCLSLSSSEMIKLIPKCFGSVNTDLTAMDAIEYYKAVNGMEMSNITMMSVPGVGANNGDQSVFSVYPRQTAEILNQHFRPYSNPVPFEQLRIRTVVKEP